MKETDRSAVDEIEITPEMVEAGVRILLADPGGVSDGVGFFSPDDLAERVYRAMREVYSSSLPRPQTSTGRAKRVASSSLSEWNLAVLHQIMGLSQPLAGSLQS